MYEPYWKLECNPFRNDCDSRFFFRSRSHQAALLKLRYLIEQEKGAGVMVGGSGSGKTYVTRMLTAESAENVGPVAHIVFPQLSASELLTYLAVELGAEETKWSSHGSGIGHTLRQLEQQLAAYAEQGRHPLLIIDDAHLIDDSRVFQTLQLLLNLQHHKARQVFSLILVGEPVLLGRVARIAPLDERLAIKSVLQPLSHQETGQYVTFRLQTAGGRPDIFDEEAFNELYAATGGVPRKINRLCDLALLVGYADKLDHITASHIEAVAEELTAVIPD